MRSNGAYANGTTRPLSSLFIGLVQEFFFDVGVRLDVCRIVGTFMSCLVSEGDG